VAASVAAFPSLAPAGCRLGSHRNALPPELLSARRPGRALLLRSLRGGNRTLAFSTAFTLRGRLALPGLRHLAARLGSSFGYLRGLLGLLAEPLFQLGRLDQLEKRGLPGVAEAPPN